MVFLTSLFHFWGIDTYSWAKDVHENRHLQHARRGPVYFAVLSVPVRVVPSIYITVYAYHRTLLWTVLLAREQKCSCRAHVR